MGLLRPDRLRDPAERERQEDVRLLLMVSEANLRRGRPDLLRVVALEAVAGDEAETARSRCRAAVALARGRLLALPAR